MNARMEEKKWAQSVADKIAEKVSVTAVRNKDKVPYTTQNGIFDDWSDRIGWWTNGFYAAQLWLLYNAYRREEYRETAEEIQNKLDAVLMDYLAMDHDAGFRFHITAVADYKITRNKKSRDRGILAAANMAGRYNLAAGLIRAWNDAGDGNTAGLAIIDCMMNLPLLYWAAKELKDPRFKHIAIAHADMAQKVFVRENGSVHHIIEFDPETGAIIGPRGGQGMQVGSSWTRGQSWALYGFTLSYLHTGKQEYLETAKKIADYVVSQIPETGFIPVDFDQPKDVLWEDSTATTIIACGLLELEKLVDGELKDKYYNNALFLLHTLEEKRCNWDNNADHIVEKCSAAYHDQNHDFTIIYGDFFFTEAILKVAEKDMQMW